MGHAILISSRNFPVNTDRWAAAVVAIDQCMPVNPMSSSKGVTGAYDCN